MSLVRPSEDKFYIAALVMVLSIGYWLYSFGLAGGFYPDDIANLAPLISVNSWGTVREFIFSGQAGPVGRPLSLFTFAMQATSWPNNASDFIYINIIIHLINGVLVYFLIRKIAVVKDISGGACFALLVTALWLLHPIQVSTILFPIQRMTLLSALFALLGMTFYIYGRMQKNNGLVAIILAFAMTVPATLCKENGILLLGFLLVLEITLFGRMGRTRRQTSLIMFWVLALFGLGGYALIYFWAIFADAAYAKGYTLSQHMASEQRVLIYYLGQIVIPRANTFGPFHDDFKLSHSWFEPQVLASLAGLITLLTIAYLARRKYPLFVIGILIYFWGHVLESSVVPLDLYFEHRNYLPSLGVVLAVFGVLRTTFKNRMISVSIAVSYVALCAFVTYQYASIWGNRDLAAMYWHSENPDSPRATLFYADFYASHQQWGELHGVVKKAWEMDKMNTDYAISTLYSLCRMPNHAFDRKSYEALRQSARDGRFSFHVTRTLNEIVLMKEQGKCSSPSWSELEEVLDCLIENERFHPYAAQIADMHFLKAKVAFNQNRYKQAIVQMRAGLELDFRFDLALEAANSFAISNNQVYAKALISLCRDRVRTDQQIKAKWMREIDSAENRVESYGRSDSLSIR